MKKHRHKWVLEYTNAGTLGKGLLYFCKCGSCLEFKRRKPDIKRVIMAYENYLKRLFND